MPASRDRSSIRLSPLGSAGFGTSGPLSGHCEAYRPHMVRIARVLAVVSILLVAGTGSSAGAASHRTVLPARAAGTPCYAEVRYADQTQGHAYEYRCGKSRLYVGEWVHVPVTRYGQNLIVRARVVAIHRYRSYFGPLKTVIGPA